MDRAFQDGVQFMVVSPSPGESVVLALVAECFHTSHERVGVRNNNADVRIDRKSRTDSRPLAEHI